jgi:hypothetical protein
MIEYDQGDWQLVTDIDQLSDGDEYFVSLQGTVDGVLSFCGDCLSNDEVTIDLSGGIPDELYVMEFNWPDPPKG